MYDEHGVARGGKAHGEGCIPVDTGVGQAGGESLDEKVAKEPTCRTSAVKLTLPSGKPFHKKETYRTSQEPRTTRVRPKYEGRSRAAMMVPFSLTDEMSNARGHETYSTKRVSQQLITHCPIRWDRVRLVRKSDKRHWKCQSADPSLQAVAQGNTPYVITKLQLYTFFQLSKASMVAAFPSSSGR